MVDVSGLKWRVDFVQDVFKAANDVVTRMADPLDEPICMYGVCMDKTEVPLIAYARIMGTYASFNGARKPVTMMGYKNAETYCNKLGKRIPTEKEYEMFTGPIEFTDHGYNNKGERVANLMSNGPTDVASYPPNRYGIYDIIGNAMEVMKREDGSYSFNYESKSWLDMLDPKFRFMSYFAQYENKDGIYDIVGFRCVVDEKK